MVEMTSPVATRYRNNICVFLSSFLLASCVSVCVCLFFHFTHGTKMVLVALRYTAVITRDCRAISVYLLLFGLLLCALGLFLLVLSLFQRVRPRLMKLVVGSLI